MVFVVAALLAAAFNSWSRKVLMHQCQLKGKICQWREQLETNTEMDSRKLVYLLVEGQGGAFWYVVVKQTFACVLDWVTVILFSAFLSQLSLYSGLPFSGAQGRFAQTGAAASSETVTQRVSTTDWAADQRNFSIFGSPLGCRGNGCTCGTGVGSSGDPQLIKEGLHPMDGIFNVKLKCQQGEASYSLSSSKAGV